MNAKAVRPGNSAHGPAGPNEIGPRLAYDIARLDPGSAAALRRGPLAGAGAAAFWQLLANHDIAQRGTTSWAVVVQAIAILTGVGGRGALETKQAAHDPKKTMGAALFGAGVSEVRLARLLAAQGSLRNDLTVRMCRRLARDPEHRKLDVRTLSWFLVLANEQTDRQIAREYYRAQAAAAAKKDSQDQGERSDA